MVEPTLGPWLSRRSHQKRMMCCVDVVFCRLYKCLSVRFTLELLRDVSPFRSMGFSQQNQQVSLLTRDKVVICVVSIRGHMMLCLIGFAPFLLLSLVLRCMRSLPQVLLPTPYS